MSEQFVTCSRRAALIALGAIAVSCRRRPAPVLAESAVPGIGSADAHSGGELEFTMLEFGDTPVGAQKAVVIRPTWGEGLPEQKFPMLIALHGRGEAHRGLDAGAWGWVHDYWLDRAMIRMRRPPIDSAALLGLTTERQLKRINDDLAAKPFGGLVVVCPFTTDIIGTPLDAAGPYAKFVAEQLIPKVRAGFPVIASPAATGIDGVSLGGRMALLVGCECPEQFGAVGTLQAAFRPPEVAALAERISRTIGKAPNRPKLRLLTSDGDYFRQVIESLASTVKSSGVPSEFLMVDGPHDYEFNRGPGSYEMLLWHDRVLRG